MRVLLIFTVFLFLPFSAQAQGHVTYCAKADSTAATQACLKRHLDMAQKRLNSVYQELFGSLDEKKQGELKDLQDTWLSYRDAECMWEAESSETPALKRINELSCMARVTEDRADILSVVSEADERVSGVREFGSFPRWMNAVAKDNPSVYWDYQDRQSYDLDCDGEDEHVMQGVRLSVEDVASFEAEDENAELAGETKVFFSQNVVVAVVQNPLTGRPSSQLFKFGVIEEAKGDQEICNDRISYKYIPDSSENSEENSSCEARLELTAKGCKSKNIIWDGKAFALQAEVADKNKEE